MIEPFRVAPSNAERGATFEQLMLRHSEPGPVLSAQYDRLWRWCDWPDLDGADTDPNDCCVEHDAPRYIVDLIKRGTTVSVETMQIVNALPELDLA